jgi:cation diffusion facilitator CzcD-associated flavoprotein CzcO
MSAAAESAATTTGPPAPRHVRVGIVGAGFGGLGMAIRLIEAGERDFVVWERDPEVGGTWWANTYPGCQCDVPSHLYSFSFAPNPAWTRTYAPQQEIADYLLGVTERYGLRPHIRTSCAVTHAAWDEAEHHWRVTTEAGEWTTDVLVAASGRLSEPSIPAVPGVDTFEGTTFHTGHWNHEHDLAGRHVAVIGTGASAIQVVPKIQPIVESLTVFQRTPPWVLPHRDRPITESERRRYARLPALQRMVRTGIYFGRELAVLGLARRPQLLRVAEHMARRHLAAQVPDPELRHRLTPSYTIGCKRILPSNHWYPALTQANVEVVTDGIDRIRPDGIVTGAGELRRVDTVILATGFHGTDLRLAHRIADGSGTLLAEHWAGSPQAYRGTTVAGFPNLFFLAGPNTSLGHTSIVFMIQAQLAYIMDALETMRARGVTRFDVRPEAQRAYNDDVQRKLARAVWNTGGCSSWYLDRTGRNTTIWPDFTFRFWERMRRFDPAAYELTRAPAARAVAPGLAPA